MYQGIRIAGFGGQGVISAGILLAQAGVEDKKNASWLPSYGPEMRGGTANCSVVVDDEEVASPIIAVPDTLIAMNTPSLLKFEDKVKSGGLIIVNSSLVDEKVKRTDVTAIYVPANELAHEAGNVRTANIVVLGAYMKYSKLFPREVMLNTIEKVFHAKPKVIPANQKAFDIGYNL